MNKTSLSLLFGLFFTFGLSAQIFSDVSAATGAGFAGNKDGGVSWADLNNDGCLDIIFNTTDNTAARRSRILLSDCNLPNPTFTDITASHIRGFTLRECDRAISIADFNNDGYLDIARNIHNRFQVYLNKGPSATPPYSFGDASQNPNLEVTSIPGGMNTEGFGWMDYNNDGWIDNNPKTGHSYYRLQQIDFDGTTTTFPIEEVFFESDKCEVNIYPNPNNGNFIIKNSKGFAGLNYMVVDQSGRQVASGVSNSSVGLELRSGIYFILILCGEEYLRKRIIIEGSQVE